MWNLLFLTWSEQGTAASSGSKGSEGQVYWLLMRSECLNGSTSENGNENESVTMRLQRVVDDVVA